VIRLHRAPEIPAWIDPSWRELLSAMTAREPADRPSAIDVAGRLATLTAPATGDTGATQVVTTSPAPEARAVHRSRSPRRLLLATVALAVAATTAVVAIAAGNGSANPADAAVDTSAYPTVAGRLGHDLRTLEVLAPTALQPGVETVAQRSAVRNFHGAQLALTHVLGALATVRARGQVDDSLNAKIATG